MWHFENPIQKNISLCKTLFFLIVC
jgi:hypothetical protein